MMNVIIYCFLDIETPEDPKNKIKLEVVSAAVKYLAVSLKIRTQ